jgi:hypothetical protein
MKLDADETSIEGMNNTIKHLFNRHDSRIASVYIKLQGRNTTEKDVAQYRRVARQTTHDLTNRGSPPARWTTYPQP